MGSIQKQNSSTFTSTLTFRQKIQYCIPSNKHPSFKENLWWNQSIISNSPILTNLTLKILLYHIVIIHVFQSTGATMQMLTFIEQFAAFQKHSICHCQIKISMTLLMRCRSTFRAWLIPCLCSKVHWTLLLWLCAQSPCSKMSEQAGTCSKIRYIIEVYDRQGLKKKKKNFSEAPRPIKQQEIKQLKCTHSTSLLMWQLIRLASEWKGPVTCFSDTFHYHLHKSNSERRGGGGGGGVGGLKLTVSQCSFIIAEGICIMH